jgi:hypothetical protein
MRTLISIALLLVPACAGQEQFSVSVPVATRCIEGDLPSSPPAMRPLTGNAQQDVVIITAQALRWRGYAEALRAVAEGCR